MGSAITAESSIGMATNGIPFTVRVATWLDVRLLYVAPTVRASGLRPGLPMDSETGPSLPAAATTSTPLLAASLTAASMRSLVLLTPKLMLTMSAPASTAIRSAATMRSGLTPSPSSDTL